MIQLWRDLITYTKRIIHDEGGNLRKMFSVPKSKSPWTAMTAGSTGEWAGWVEPLGPLITKGLAATGSFTYGLGTVGAAGMGAMGALGKGTGYQGSDFGNANWGSTLGGAAGGAIGGYGYLGGAGSAVKDYATGNYGDARSVSQPNWRNQSALGGVGSGLLTFGQSYLGGKTDKAAGNWIKGGGFQNAYNAAGSFGAGGGAGAGVLGGDGGGGSNLISQYAGQGGQGAGIVGTTGTRWGRPATSLNWGNISKQILGAGMMAGSAMMKPPTIGTKPERAMEAVNSPNLVQARDMMKTMAMENPNEFANSAELGEFIDKTVAQSEKAYLNQRKIVENNLAAKGKTLDKSGGAQYIMSEFDKNYQTGVQDFIADTRWTAYQAGMNRQVKAVAQYYGVAEREALMTLESYGYISPEDALNFEMAMKDYESTKQMLAYGGGQLMAPQYA